MFLLTQILCVKCNVLYIGGPNVQVRGGSQAPSAGPGGDQMHLVAYVCNEIQKRENLSLSITLNHNPSCNISGLRDISVSLLRKNAL